MSAKPARDGKRNVAFKFMSAEINFWKMHFPVAGTKPIRRTCKRCLNRFLQRRWRDKTTSQIDELSPNS